MFLAALAGCGGKSADGGSNSGAAAVGANASGSAAPSDDSGSKYTEPVTLTFYQFYAGLSDKELDQYFIQPLKKKFPNVTLKKIYSGLQGPLDAYNILASGENPDLIYTSNYSLPIFKDAKLQEKLDDYIKKNKFDMSKFDPVILDTLKKYNSDGTYAIPFSVNVAPLFYNKAIFDKFAVPYPKDQSTWDDIVELNNRLTRQDGGVQYRGIIPPVAKQLGDQLALTYAKDNKATINNDQWKKVLELYQRFFTNQAMLDNGKIPEDKKMFFEQQTSAMYTNWADSALATLSGMAEKGQPMNWDMTTYPAFKESPGIGRRVDFHLMMVSPTSKHKDLVFEIIAYVTSEEIQMDMTKNARMTALNNNEIKKHYAENFDIMKGKNMNAIINNKSAGINPSDYDVELSGYVNQAGYDVALGRKDINTALRERQEQGDKYIAEQLAK